MFVNSSSNEVGPVYFQLALRVILASGFPIQVENKDHPREPHRETLKTNKHSWRTTPILSNFDFSGWPRAVKNKRTTHGNQTLPGKEQELYYGSAVKPD